MINEKTVNWAFNYTVHYIYSWSEKKGSDTHKNVEQAKAVLYVGREVLWMLTDTYPLITVSTNTNSCAGTNDK